MSRILPLHYLLILILLFLVFLTINPVPISAVDQNNFDVIQIPKPFSIDNSDISITVKTKDGSNYFVEDQYSFAAWKGTLYKDASCTFNNFSGAASSPLTKIDETTVAAKWKIIKGACGFIGDQWHFRLWRGTGWSAMGRPDNIIKDYSFVITPSSGQLVTITAKNPDVYQGEQPTVILSNVEPNKDYTFWWKDEWKDIAAYYLKNKDPNNPLEVKVPFGNFNYDKSPRRLCMEYGNFLAPPPGNNSCNIPGKYADFNFKNEKRPLPTTPIKCIILPSASLSLNSQVGIKIENVASGTEVFAYAIDDKNNKWSTAHAVSESTFSVTMTIVNKADEGSYRVAAYTGTDPSTNICASSLPNTAFIVSSNPNPSIPSANPCTDDPASCTSAAGATATGCGTGDNRGPALKTAIGCIHTNPAELVKDLMTFLIGIGGGLAFLMMLFGAFQMLTSGGNPETLNAGRSRLTSAVIGLLFVIFAVLLLQIIGVDILKIPGFGR